MAASSIRLKIAAAPFPESQEARYCSATEMLLRIPFSVIVPPGTRVSCSSRASTRTSSRLRSFWCALPSLRSKTSFATGTRSGCATQVPSNPSATSRSLSARVCASAFSLTSGFFRVGMNGAIPPMACASRRWQVFTRSSVYARMKGTVIVICWRSGRMRSFRVLSFLISEKM